MLWAGQRQQQQACRNKFETSETSLPHVMQVRGMIFASGLRRDVFTAGNDIKELFAPLTSQQRYT